MTDWPIIFVLVCAACAAVCITAMGYTGGTLKTFGRQVDEARRMLNALIDRLK